MRNRVPKHRNPAGESGKRSGAMPGQGDGPGGGLRHTEQRRLERQVRTKRDFAPLDRFVGPRQPHAQHDAADAPIEPAGQIKVRRGAQGETFEVAAAEIGQFEQLAPGRAARRLGQCLRRFSQRGLQTAANRVPLERHQRRVVVFPRVGGQAGLQAHLTQKAHRVQAVFDGHAGQQQSPVASPRDLETVLADDHGLGPLFAVVRDGLAAPQQPHLHLEIVDFGERDRGKTWVLARGPNRRVLEGLGQRHRRSQVAAARPELPGPLQADERAEHGGLGHVAEDFLEAFGG